MTVRRWLIAGAAIGVALAGLWAPAALAQSSGGDVGASTDSFVVLTGRLEVKSGETFNDAVIFDGDADDGRLRDRQRDRLQRGRHRERDGRRGRRRDERSGQADRTAPRWAATWSRRSHR